MLCEGRTAPETGRSQMLWPSTLSLPGPGLTQQSSWAHAPGETRSRSRARALQRAELMSTILIFLRHAMMCLGRTEPMAGLDEGFQERKESVTRKRKCVQANRSN